MSSAPTIRRRTPVYTDGIFMRAGLTTRAIGPAKTRAWALGTTPRMQQRWDQGEPVNLLGRLAEALVSWERAGIAGLGHAVAYLRTELHGVLMTLSEDDLRSRLQREIIHETERQSALDPIEAEILGRMDDMPDAEMVRMLRDAEQRAQAHAADLEAMGATMRALRSAIEGRTARAGGR